MCGPGEVEGEIVVMRLEAQRTIPQDTELTIRYNSYMMVSLKDAVCSVPCAVGCVQCVVCRDQGLMCSV